MLSLVFIIGAIIILAAGTIAFLTISFLNSTYGYPYSERAKAVAASGAYDAFLRLDRNKDFSSTGYAVPVGNDTASVVIAQDSPSVGLVTITSSATVFSRQRRVRAIVSRDASSSMISLVSWDRS